MNDGRFDGGRLSPEQKSIREWYGKLIHATRSAVFTAGEFYGLNHANHGNPNFGRVGDESISGHWLCAFLRHDPESGESFIIVSNFCGSETLENVKISLPENAWEFMGRQHHATWKFTDRLDSTWSAEFPQVHLADQGVLLPNLAPCSAMVIEIISFSPPA